MMPLVVPLRVRSTLAVFADLDLDQYHHRPLIALAHIGPHRPPGAKIVCRSQTSEDSLT
ncbi:hypothetical protein LINGRAHAP2_LOCUS22493, partial [Linum grandiflorum]